MFRTEEKQMCFWHLMYECFKISKNRFSDAAVEFCLGERIRNAFSKLKEMSGEGRILKAKYKIVEKCIYHIQALYQMCDFVFMWHKNRTCISEFEIILNPL